MVATTFLVFHALRTMPDPEALGLWQAELGRRLGLCGRVVLAPQGLHGIVGGSPQQLGEYAAATKQHQTLADVRFSWSEGRGSEAHELTVSVRADVSGFGATAERQVSGVELGRDRQLTPHQVHDLVAASGEEVVFVDGRSRRASEVGRFRGALVPDADESRDVLRDLDNGRFDGLEDRPVVIYSAGGLRSEILGSLMVQRGFSQVYALDGGIVSYGTAFADRGLWEGALYVLGERVQIVFGDHTSAIGGCETCGARTYSYRACVAPLCTAHALLCNGCADFALCVAHRN
ncbi:rhodanese-like domain-containing protein [uncultured Friedmanniella sp.]|uniref:rhodanese-like domain-containing protein n=1 Tax=uncultured Friedmanniella sp. TaxID=335381 RepID=UPI0035CA5734